MSSRTTSIAKTLVDPLFRPPIGAEEEFVFSRENTDQDDYLIENERVENDDTDDGWDDREETVLAVPEGFSILSQSLKRAPGGQQVVDLVFDVPDVDGAVRYEIQVTKI